MATSQNGYTANDPSLTQSWKIPGTARAVRLRKGSPGNLLVLWAAWFDKNVEDIEAGQLDDWGYAERPIRGSTTTLSNHASGTAIDLNSTKHPLAAVGTFTAAQASKIRSQLKAYGGCIRWGGDYAGRKDEMHFEIVKDVATCNKVLVALTATDTPPQEDELMGAREDILDYQKACTVQIQNNTRQLLNNAVNTLLDGMQKYAVAVNDFTRQTDSGSDAERQAALDKLRADLMASLKPLQDATADVPEPPK